MKTTSNLAKGLIHQKNSLEHFNLVRLQPSKNLACFIEHYWVIKWDLQGKPSYIQENLPHPSQHIVIDPQAVTGIFGISEGRFVYVLKGSGRIFGVKFWPGAFHAFYKNPVSQIYNKNIKITEVFNVQDRGLIDSFLAYESLNITIDTIEKMLHEKLPKLTLKAIQARKIVHYIEVNKELVTVEGVAQEFSLTIRSLQRLFATYIGVTPKWVINRYRIIDAIEALNKNNKVDLTALSHKLGYFDLAHFSKIFTALIGYPPSYYSLK